jgi:hypothetical protein
MDVGLRLWAADTAQTASDARTDCACAAVERAGALADAAQAKRAPDAHANT